VPKQLIRTVKSINMCLKKHYLPASWEPAYVDNET